MVGRRKGPSKSTQELDSAEIESFSDVVEPSSINVDSIDDAPEVKIEEKGEVKDVEAGKTAIDLEDEHVNDLFEDVTNGQKTPVEAGKVENGQEDTSKNAIGDGAEQDDENQDGAAAVTKTVSSKLPLVCLPKIDDKVIIAEASDLTLDLSGDVGAVGRIMIRDKTDLSFDLKGTIYDAKRVASNTLCIVTIGEAEAKISTITDEYLSLSASVDLAGGEKVTKGSLYFGEDEDEDAVEKSEGKESRKRSREENGVVKNATEQGNKRAAPKRKAEGRKSSSSTKSRGKRKPTAKK